MHDYNYTRLTLSLFILNRAPGLASAHIWISLPYCFMYIVTILGNYGLLYLIHPEEALHQLMYYFLALLSFTDIVPCVPQMLCRFWFDLKDISFNACLVQMCFLHTITGMESGVLRLTGLD